MKEDNKYETQYVDTTEEENSSRDNLKRKNKNKMKLNMDHLNDETVSLPESNLSI